MVGAAVKSILVIATEEEEVDIHEDDGHVSMHIHEDDVKVDMHIASYSS